jgi:hypothetical protein
MKKEIPEITEVQGYLLYHTSKNHNNTIERRWNLVTKLEKLEKELLKLRRIKCK